jgi:murein DD-endopeptidase MepM/ murein hydrolase activator NlpD
LFGPSHGYQKLSTFRSRTSVERDKDSIVALKQELNLLKRDLRKIEDAKEENKLTFNPGQFERPGPGKIFNLFNWVNSAGAWKLHSGVDIGTEPDSNVIPAAPGKVAEVKLANDGTYTVRIDHGNGWESLYAGLSQINTAEGSIVIQGVVLGKSGYSVCGFENPGFHFSIYHDGQPVDPQKIVRGMMP